MCHRRQGHGRYEIACFVHILSAPKSVASATLTRGHTIYASGTAFTSKHGTRLLLTRRRALEPGIYTLLLRRWRHGKWSSSQQSVTIG